MSKGRERAQENLDKQAQFLKDGASEKFENKHSALKDALKNRLDNPTKGLPRSFSAFLRWKGEEGELEDIFSSRSSLNSPDENRARLKKEINETIQQVKNPLVDNLEPSAEFTEQINQKDIQLEGLAAANHELETEIVGLRDDLKALQIERDRLLKNIEDMRNKSKSNIVELV